mgnify:CR=1 FL=1
MTINFIKMHGLKNDFIIIDGREKKVYLQKNLIKKIANRKNGLGCDQIIILEKPTSLAVVFIISIVVPLIPIPPPNLAHSYPPSPLL